MGNEVQWISLEKKIGLARRQFEGEASPDDKIPLRPEEGVERARGTIDGVIAELFGDGNPPRNAQPSPADGAFYSLFSQISVNKASDIPIKEISSILYAVDLFGRLHQYEVSPRTQPLFNQVRAIVEWFPGLLTHQKILKKSLGREAPFLGMDCFRKYSSPGFFSFNDENLNGQIPAESNSLVDALARSSEYCPTHGLPVYIAFMSRYLDEDTIQFEQIMENERLSHQQMLRGMESGMQSSLQSRVYQKFFMESNRNISEMVRKELETYSAALHEGLSLKDWNGKLSRTKQLMRSRKESIRAARNQLYKLLPQLNKEELGLLLHAPFRDDDWSSEDLISNIRAGLVEFKKFSCDPAIPQQYSGAQGLVEAFKHLGISPFNDPGGFFKRLRWGISYGLIYNDRAELKKLREEGIRLYPENIGEAVRCAFHHIDGWGLISLISQKGGVMDVFLSLPLNEQDRALPEDFYVIKIRKPSSRVSEIAESIGVDIEVIDKRTFVGSLRHPNICQTFPLGREGMYCEVLCYRTLEDTVRKNIERAPNKPPFSRMEVGKIIGDVGVGLAYIHRKGLVHNDFKPNNILFKDGSYFISDFGIRVTGKSEGATGGNIGGLLIMAPELNNPGNAPNAMTDLYSFGIFLFYCATGNYPYSPNEIIRRLNLLWDIPADGRTLEDIDIHYNVASGRDESKLQIVVRQNDERFLEQTAAIFGRSLGSVGAGEALKGLLHPEPGHRFKSVEDFIRESSFLWTA